MISRRLGLLVAGCTHIFLFGGVVYGWPSMRAILRDESCTGDCQVHQARQFGVAYSVGVFSAEGLRFISGMILDWIGPKRTISGISGFVAIGYLLLCLASSQLVALCFAILLIGLGSGMQISVQSISELFPGNQSFILGNLTAAQVLGCLPWLILKLLFVYGGVSKGVLFGTYSSIAASYALISLLIWCVSSPWCSNF